MINEITNESDLTAMAAKAGKPYQSPALVQFGAVHLVTQGPVSGPFQDGSSGMTMPTA